MKDGAASVTFGPEGARIDAGPALPVAQMMTGLPVEEAIALLPRIFNLCPMAQATAARLSLGWPAAGNPAEEVIRDHAIRLAVTLPATFGLPSGPVPTDVAVFLGPRGLPAELDALPGWTSPAAALLGRVADRFPRGIATCDALPPPPDDPLAAGAWENSAAGRQARHPLLRAAEARFGRGPLWRLLGLLADLEAAIQGGLPPPRRLSDGTAVVTAARGAYALRLSAGAGRVTALARRTPTDHLLARGGALEQALCRLPAGLRHLAPWVIALHDPCIPVVLREVQPCTR